MDSLNLSIVRQNHAISHCSANSSATWFWLSVIIHKKLKIGKKLAVNSYLFEKAVWNDIIHTTGLAVIRGVGGEWRIWDVKLVFRIFFFLWKTFIFIFKNVFYTFDTVEQYYCEHWTYFGNIYISKIKRWFPFSGGGFFSKTETIFTDEIIGLSPQCLKW